MSTYNIKNYRTTHFQHPTLDKIHGQPTLDSILHLIRQLKINAQNVPTTLGGGQLGYLALVLPENSYTAIPNAAPFLRPAHPGPFVVNTQARTSTRSSTPTPTVSAAVVTQQKAEWDEQVRLYNECQAVEQALRQQLVEAVESDYLDAIRNQHTEMIQHSIPDIIAHLRNTYGSITEEELSEREDALKAYVYDPTYAVDTVFTKIKKHQELASLMDNPLTDKQQVSIAYKIFNRAGVFQNDLIKWNTRNDNNKSLNDLKIHMRNSWNELNKVGALKLRDVNLNNVNFIREVTDKQQELADSMREEFSNQLKSSIADAMLMLQVTDNTPSTYTEPSSSSNESANSINTLSTMESMISTIQELKKEIANLKASKPTNPDVNPKTGKPWKRYCWTHGCCPHSSRNCPNKAAGHIDNATFKNRQGGSNKNCIG